MSTLADATCTITGACGGEPELCFTAGGDAVCTFSVAVERRYKKNDEWTGITTWWKVTVWKEYAENVAASAHKGTRVTCTGYPEIEEWEDREGLKRQTLTLRADDVAVNLRWARAEVEKVARETRTGQTSTSTGSGGRAANPKRDADPVYGEEEPFVRPADIGDL